MKKETFLAAPRRRGTGAHVAQVFDVRGKSEALAQNTELCKKQDSRPRRNCRRQYDTTETVTVPGTDVRETSSKAVTLGEGLHHRAPDWTLR